MSRKQRKDFLDAIDSRSKKPSVLAYPDTLMDDLKKANLKTEQINKEYDKAKLSADNTPEGTIDGSLDAIISFHTPAIGAFFLS